jgi:hypothetical protein
VVEVVQASWDWLGSPINHSTSTIVHTTITSPIRKFLISAPIPPDKTPRSIKFPNGEFKYMSTVEGLVGLKEYRSTLPFIIHDHFAHLAVILNHILPKNPPCI